MGPVGHVHEGYFKMAEITVGLARYLDRYNAERRHQASGYEMPDHVYGPLFEVARYFSTRSTTHHLNMSKTALRRSAGAAAEL